MRVLVAFTLSAALLASCGEETQSAGTSGADATLAKSASATF